MTLAGGQTTWADDRQILDLAVEHLVSVCARIGDGQLGVATPCADWNLQGLLDHVVGGNRFTSEILAGATSDHALATARQSFSSGPTRVADVATSAKEMRQRFGGSGVRGRLHSHVLTDLTGHQVLRLRLQDLIIHSWDIAEATSPPASLPGALVRWGQAELDDPGSLTSDYFATDRSSLSTTASLDRYLASFGRSRSKLA